MSRFVVRLPAQNCDNDYDDNGCDYDDGVDGNHDGEDEDDSDGVDGDDEWYAATSRTAKEGPRVREPQTTPS